MDFRSNSTIWALDGRWLLQASRCVNNLVGIKIGGTKTPYPAISFQIGDSRYFLGIRLESLVADHVL